MCYSLYCSRIFVNSITATGCQPICSLIIIMIIIIIIIIYSCSNVSHTCAGSALKVLTSRKQESKEARSVWPHNVMYKCKIIQFRTDDLAVGLQNAGGRRLRSLNRRWRLCFWVGRFCCRILSYETQRWFSFLYRPLNLFQVLIYFKVGNGCWIFTCQQHSCCTVYGSYNLYSQIMFVILQ